MDQQIKSRINQKVYQQYPAVKGVNPKVQLQSKTKGTYLFTYKSSATVSNNKKLPIIVKVVCTAEGKILKMSTSR